MNSSLPANPTPQLEDLIEIGTIVAPQGLKGEVRVYPTSDFPERFEDPGLRWLQYPSQPNPQPIRLLKGRKVAGKELYVIQLEGIDSRDQAEILRNCKLSVERTNRPLLDEDEYHVDELIDLEVFHHETGEAIGVVTDIYWAGHDLLEVKLHRPLAQAEKPNEKKKSQKPPKLVEKVMIPFVKAIVPVVDLESGRLEIDPPSGLLEVNLG
jgi:16S rRNA processing protein RimM